VVLRVTQDDLDPDVRRFIVERVDAIELLEVALALRAGRDRDHDAEGLARALGSNAASIGRRLRALEAIGIARPHGAAWRYEPAPALDDLIGRVERAYRERRLSVINLIYAPKPNDITLFSDAFRLRDPKKEDER